MKKILLLFFLVFITLSTITSADVTPIKSFLENGGTVTDPFYLPQGSAIFSMQSTGGSNFIVWLLDENGKKINLLANEIGLFSGSRGVQVPQSGNYALDVKASSLWSIKISRPKKEETEKFTFIRGAGSKGTPLYYFDRGFEKFDMKYKGDKNFIVWLFDANGEKIDLLVNEIGSFNGLKEIYIPSQGSYMFDIQADGNWDISLK